MKSLPEEETDNEGSETDSGEDDDKPSGRTAPGLLTSDSDIPPSPFITRSRKAKKEKKGREPFHKDFKGEGVVYHPEEINVLSKKLRLLAADFFAGNTTVGNELGHVLDALLRFKQLTRKAYTNIIARLAASL